MKAASEQLAAFSVFSFAEKPRHSSRIFNCREAMRRRSPVVVF
jgi:hypothetical protein